MFVVSSVLFIGAFLVSFDSFAQKAIYQLKVQKVVYNTDSSFFPTVQEFSGEFKKNSDLIEIWEYDGGSILIQLELLEEGYGKDKYMVHKSKYYHIKGKRRSIIATTPRHRFDKKYFKKGRLEYHDPNSGDFLAVVFELTLNTK